MKPFRYTEEEHAWLKENIPGNSYKDIAQMFSERFRPIEVKKIHAYCKNHKISTGRTGRFQKGNVPFTKEKKQSEYMTPEAIERTKATRFQKGIRPHNTVPVGTERNLIGYIEIKVAEPNVWKLKHRVLWEKAYGPIPEGHYVRFRDGNHFNFDLNNLIIVDKSTHMSMTRLRMQNPPEGMFETALLIAKLDALTNKKRKNR